MIAIITGDIVNLVEQPTSEWITTLKEYFSRFGASPMNWEMYGGNAFQLKVNQTNALLVAVQIKALLKSIKNIDVRMAIGIGLETYMGSGVNTSTGPAYKRSGRQLQYTKNNKVSLSITTGKNSYDRTLNLMLRLALNFMDDWSVVSAEIVAMVLDNPQASQKEIAQKLGIKQSAVSQRLKRARMDLLVDVLQYYAEIHEEF